MLFGNLGNQAASAGKRGGLFKFGPQEDEREQGGILSRLGNMAQNFTAERDGIGFSDRLMAAGMALQGDGRGASAHMSGLQEQGQARQARRAQQGQQHTAAKRAMDLANEIAPNNPAIRNAALLDPAGFVERYLGNMEASTLSGGQTRHNPLSGQNFTADDFGVDNGQFYRQGSNGVEIQGETVGADAVRANIGNTQNQIADRREDNALARDRFALDTRNVNSQIEDRAADNARDGQASPDALRQEYEDDYARPFEGAQDQFLSMRTLATDQTGASDTALIFSFFKTIDPSSTVREGEFALAAQSMGLSDRLLAQMQRADNGQILVGDARAELVTAASRALQERANTVERARSRYTELVGDSGERLIRNPVAPGTFGAPSSDNNEPLTTAEQRELADLERRFGAQ